MMEDWWLRSVGTPGEVVDLRGHFQLTERENDTRFVRHARSVGPCESSTGRVDRRAAALRVRG